MGLLDLTDDAIHAQQLAQIRGTVIELGPEAKLTTPIGARVICRRYAGELVTGNDDIFRYRVMNDKDIWATFEDGLRQPLIEVPDKPKEIPNRDASLEEPPSKYAYRKPDPIVTESTDRLS